MQFGSIGTAASGLLRLATSRIVTFHAAYSSSSKLFPRLRAAADRSSPTLAACSAEGRVADALASASASRSVTYRASQRGEHIVIDATDALITRSRGMGLTTVKAFNRMCTWPYIGYALVTNAIANRHATCARAPRSSSASRYDSSTAACSSSACRPLDSKISASVTKVKPV